MDDGEQLATLQENARIDTCSWNNQYEINEDVPVSARTFFFPTPAQFCLEEDWFGLIFESHGTILFIFNLTFGESMVDGTLNCVRISRGVERFREPAMTIVDKLSRGRRKRRTTSMICKTA